MGITAQQALLKRASVDRSPNRPPWARAACLLVCLLVSQAGPRAAFGQAIGPDPDAQVYLSQLEPALADAQSNLDDLQYYLPLASVDDANDPTWGLAQQASDAVRDDADVIETLSPPDALAQLNQALITALEGVSSSADGAITALSGGDETAGQTDLHALSDGLAALALAENGLPQESDTPSPSP